jgi:ComEC/Rec2-related protein
MKLLKNNVIFLFLLFLPIFIADYWLQGFFQKSNAVLPEKGFVRAYFPITDFPELRPDGQYQVRSGNIKIIFTNSSLFYKTESVELTGFISSFSFGNRKYAHFYANEIISKKEGWPFFKTVSLLRKWVNDKILSVKNADTRNLLFAMILANTNFMPYAASESFKMTGLTHLLAISGLNVAIISLCVVFLLKKIIPERWAYGAAFIVVLSYVALAGFGASILRAGIMFLIYNGLRMTGRNVEFVDVVLVSALIVLLFSPPLIGNAGFWLSYTAVLGLYFFAEIFKKLFLFTGKIASEILSATLAASIATLPILLYYFKSTSIVSPLANLLVIWPFNFITFGLFIEFLLVISGLSFIAKPIEWCIIMLWKFSLLAADSLSQIPFAYQTIPAFSEWALFSSYAVLTALFFGIPGLSYYLSRRKLSLMIAREKENEEPNEGSKQ